MNGLQTRKKQLEEIISLQVLQLFKVVGKHGLISFLKLPIERKDFRECEKPQVLGNSIENFSCAYTTSINEESVFAERKSRRKLQRTVASSSVYGKEKKDLI